MKFYSLQQKMRFVHEISHEHSRARVYTLNL